MGNIWKRSLSMFLAVLMVVGMLPVNAFAAEGEVTEVTEAVETTAPETTEAPAETQAPAETEAPAQTEAPATEAPAETEAPKETEAPVETTVPAETEGAVIVSGDSSSVGAALNSADDPGELESKDAGTIAISAFDAFGLNVNGVPAGYRYRVAGTSSWTTTYTGQDATLENGKT